MSPNESINSTPIGQKIDKSVIHLGPRPDQVIPAYYHSLLEPVHTVTYGPQGSKWANALGSTRSSNNSLGPNCPVSFGYNGFHSNSGRARAVVGLHVSASEKRHVMKRDGKKTWVRGSQIGWCGKDDTDSDFVKNFYKDGGLSGGGFVGGATEKEGSGNGGCNGHQGGTQNNDEIY